MRFLSTFGKFEESENMIGGLSSIDWRGNRGMFYMKKWVPGFRLVLFCTYSMSLSGILCFFSVLLKNKRDERDHKLSDSHIFGFIIQNDLSVTFFLFGSLFFLSKTMKNKNKIFLNRKFF